MHVSTSVKYWDDVGEKFYNKYAGLEALYQRNMALVASGKPLIGPLGRFWPLEMERDWKGELKIPETKVVNYPVQGTGADVMMIARISFLNRLKSLGLQKVILLVSSVHDSIVVDAEEKYLQLVTNTFHQVFDDLQKNIWKLFKYEWVVPLACEVKYGPNLKDMTKKDRND
jgi:DNA polymerase I-like protein with 3'-5' exonuclease and polymerase domains